MATSEGQSPAAENEPPPYATVTSLMMRKWAESADGHRDVDMVLVWRESNQKYAIIPQSAIDTDTDQDDTLCLIRTDYENRTRGDQTVNVAISAPMGHATDRGIRDTDVTKVYDALFWSEAAVEKFMLPYYVRVLSWQELAFVRNAYFDPNFTPPILGFGHTPDSDYDSIKSGGIHVFTADGAMPLSTFLLQYFSYRSV